MAAEAKVTPDPIRPDRADELISDWFERRGFRSVALQRIRDPQADPDARYVVEYEARFITPGLEQAQVEVWATRDGDVGIGLETKGRIAERVGVRTRRNGFAAGHEPAEMSESGLLGLLDCVADGEIAISARVVPLLGVTRTDAVLLKEENRTALSSAGYAPMEWLRPRRGIERLRRLLRFEPWR